MKKVQHRLLDICLIQKAISLSEAYWASRSSLYPVDKEDWTQEIDHCALYSISCLQSSLSTGYCNFHQSRRLHSCSKIKHVSRRLSIGLLPSLLLLLLPSCLFLLLGQKANQYFPLSSSRTDSAVSGLLLLWFLDGIANPHLRDKNSVIFQPKLKALFPIRPPELWCFSDFARKYWSCNVATD